MNKRKVHINQEEWEWTMGGIGVIIWSPEGKKYEGALEDVTGINFYEAERMAYKRTLHVVPSQVKTYIEEHILKG